MKKFISQKQFLIIVVTFVLSFASNALAQQDSVSQPVDKKAKKEKPKFDGVLEGKVTDDNGKPIANADVYILVVGAVNFNSKGASTDDSGKFRVKNLPPGMYRVNVSSSGYVMSPMDRPKQTELEKFYRAGESVNITMIKGGVITGKVTDASGDPIVGVTVHAVRVRGNGDSITDNYNLHTEKRTDDRGIYRMYGLAEGRYLVYAGRSQYQNLPTAFDRDSPTYYPSSTRDTAAIINLQSGEESTGIDIRYRNERGFSVSGIIRLPAGIEARWSSVNLTDPTNNLQISYTQAIEQDGRRGFEFRGVGDGDYKINVSSSTEGMESLVGLLRVQVKGADVSGLEIKVAPLASISGKVVLNEDPKPNCESQTGGILEETLFRVSRDKITDPNIREPYTEAGATANNQGAFTLRGLQANTYRLRTQLPTEDWYIQSIVRQTKDARSTANPKTKVTNVVSQIPELIALKEGEKLTDMVINLSDGAASVRGRVVSKTEGAPIPANLRLYLVPTEKERVDDTLRYAEVPIEESGTFTVINIASGRYWLLARVVNEESTNPRPLSWDAAARAKLRKEAEAANNVLELKPCQQLKDFQFRF